LIKGRGNCFVEEKKKNIGIGIGFFGMRDI